jgi:hypothetical protein
MTPESDSPSGKLVRVVWAVVGAWVAALAWDALVDNTDDGDPAASVGHEVASVGPIACVAFAAIVVGAIGASRSRPRSATRTAFELLALGGLSQLGSLAWAFVTDVTTPHDGGYDGLLLSGIGAFFVAAVWLTVLGRRREPRASSGRTELWGRWAYLVVFGSLSALAALTLVVPPDAPNAAAAVIGSHDARASWGPPMTSRCRRRRRCARSSPAIPPPATTCRRPGKAASPAAGG